MKILTFITTILLIVSSANAGEWIQVAGGVSQLDLDQHKIESLLWQHLSKFKEYEFHPREEYTYQYQASTEEVIYINAFCDNFFSRFDLRKNFLEVEDGGACYFQIHYNFKTGRFFDLQVNGEA